MQKIFNSALDRDVIIIMPGEYYISSSGDYISTMLGSCISVCLFDPKVQISGMNHFLLPQYNGKDINLFSSTRYGISAMETLIMKMQLKGVDRDRLQAKVFGGGNVLSLATSPHRVGERNIRFIHEYMKTEGIRVLNEDTGGSFSRRVLLNSTDFSVTLNKIPVDSTIIHTEEDYAKRLTEMQEKTEIVYF